MRRIVLATGAAVLVGMVLLAGCSQANPGKAGSGGGVADSAQGKGAAAGAVPNGNGARAAVPGAPAPAGPALQVKAPVTSAALIRTADLVVEIAHGPDVAAQA
ncbi:MAG: hypothetical protein JWP07_3564, partial [Pseudonocardiales bacterium]|nr:hypothetical protein [Pseudonocardiales bacterium]